jgi:hypothetical protein
MVVERSVIDRDKARQAIRDCREQARQGEAALWLNAEWARRLGVPLSEIAALAGVSPETARARLRQVSGGA